MKAPRTLTFQPQAGAREALEAIAAEKDRSLSWVVNSFLRLGLRTEGYEYDPDAERIEKK